ncbi:hypothetical protein G3N59_15665 [Paraburkholderia sp. Ac-20340]|uniref:hypothetical protein n=1 Tax=Paraburkholderia sp. Ac-20340 TaxID=2703888 RepID=UPI001980A736|nr:hypothetical protein [Paraburkholderia sp. Ac-20340]MBN3854821.1 hypothetical protein [Paraburkholderia sp. Ac-20340]
MTTTKHRRDAAGHVRSTHSAKGERPGNRPPGAPWGAAIAAGAFFLAAGGTLVEVYSCFADFAGFPFEQYMLEEIGIAAALMLLIGMGCRSGKLWAIRLFRWSTHAAACLFIAMAICAVWFATGTPARDPAFSFVFVLLAVLQIPAFIIVYRQFARVRWLDPKSLPFEWELPARPNLGKGASAVPIKIGVGGWVIRALIAIAITLRYYLGLIRSDWFAAWLANGNLLHLTAVLAAICVPFIVIGLTFWWLLRQQRSAAL